MLDRLRDVMCQAGSDRGQVAEDPVTPVVDAEPPPAGSVRGQVAEDRAFLAEAEAVVLYDPIFPADPFAP